MYNVHVRMLSFYHVNFFNWKVFDFLIWVIQSLFASLLFVWVTLKLNTTFNNITLV